MNVAPDLDKVADSDKKDLPGKAVDSDRMTGLDMAEDWNKAAAPDTVDIPLLDNMEEDLLPYYNRHIWHS